MNDHLKGILITALGVLCVVPDSLFVRVIDAAPMTTAFGRAFMSGATVLVFLLAFQGLEPFRRLFRAGRPALLFTVLLGSTAPGFVLAIANTSVANVVFIFAATPVFAAAFSRIFLGEPISRRMIVTMAVVFAGLGIIAYGSGENDIASWKGDLFAVYVSCVFAGTLTVARSVKETPMAPAIPFAYLGAAVLMAPFAEPTQVFQSDLPTFLIYGIFMGAGSCLLSLGPRYIPSAEVSLLILLESVLAPILVWAWIGENPGKWALLGGVVVIGALIVSNMVSLRNSRKDQTGAVQ